MFHRCAARASSGAYWAGTKPGIAPWPEAVAPGSSAWSAWLRGRGVERGLSV
jgi:hypothetical protein